MYEKVSSTMNFVEREKRTEQFWRENKIFEKSIEARKEGETFYEKLANVIHYGGQIAIVDKEACGLTHGPNKAVSSELLPTEDVEYRLSLEGVRNGIKLALEGHDARAKKAVHHFLAKDETFDSDCADFLLQMCLFGEVVYGW